MTTIIFLAASLSVCITVTSSAAILTPVVSSISSQYHAQDALGQYSYGYTNSLSSKSEIRTADGTTRGGYSYIDPEGKLQSIEYSSDPVNGFRAIGSSIPSVPQSALELQQPVPVSDTPEVAEARAQHLAAVEEAKLRLAGQQSLIITPVVPGVIQQIPGSVSFRTEFIPGSNSLHFVPAFSYSYNVPGGFFNQPLISSYTAPVALANRADIPQTSEESQQQNIVPEGNSDAPKVKSELPAAVEPDLSKQQE